MILIVDDDQAVLHSLELLLKQAGFATVGATDPAAALEHMASPDLELVLQDMNFSRRTTGEEGLELLSGAGARIVRRRGSGCRGQSPVRVPAGGLPNRGLGSD